MLQVLYLVHDLADPAVRRRVIMLKAGGAGVTLAGFRRSPEPVEDVAGVRPIDLGKTSDGRFAQRLAAVAKAALTLKAALRNVAKPDVIIGRNLEMLALANRARAIFGGGAGNVPIVYECLDVHRLLLRQDATGRALRSAERLLGRDVGLLVTSSPAFIRNYFEPFGQIDAPVELLENKVLELEAAKGTETEFAMPPTESERWKIGWFGALRCRRSLELLAEFTRRMEGRVEIVLRGRPAYTEFDDFGGFVAAEPFMQFQGAYRNPEDLPRIYGEVHFAWAIDFFEAGLNSDWLLPNRLYESCRHHCVPIAIEGTETARFLDKLGIGFRLAKPDTDELVDLFSHLDGEVYERARGKIAMQNQSLWMCNEEDCRAFVSRLRGLAPIGAGALEPIAA
jgi:succinoglycan biosynthesis protein ExoL